MTARRIAGVAAVLLLLGAGACSKAKTKSEPDAQGVKIDAPADGTTVKGNTVSLALTATGLTIVKPDGDTSGKTGHFHIFIDRTPPAAGEVMPKEPGIVHSPKSPTLLTGLTVGSHTITAVIGNGGHQRIGNASSTIKVQVDGPSIQAKAAPTATLGQPVTVTVTVAGVTLVKADANSPPAGLTGHLHVLVDGDPPAAGQPIAKVAGIIHTTDTTIPVPGLTAGEHTIWVVLGGANHVPFEPPVMDKVVVTVS